MKTVFTNGCFDILHVGHIRLLRFAKSLGDHLIVGLNSNDSIRQIKGEHRPLIHEDHRKEILESIRWVDDVIIFDQPTPYELIREVRPNILVKGEDWKGQYVIGYDLVDRVVFFPFQDGHSTTKIVEKI
jgi:D-beta-D-heptose 7-phosphate kinase/D-beta-D-heptose 1-phosphate adenosyltransferase